MEPHYRQGYEIISARPTSKKEEYFKRLLILCAVFSSIYFLFWLSNSEHIAFVPLYSILVVSVVYATAKVYLEWFAVWKFNLQGPVVSKKNWAVDVLTTYCAGEPKEMVINTLQAIQKMKYPHTTYLCDEDNDPELKRWCEELGVIHVTRKEKKDAKAGNINNALRNYAKGELCLILDPDHIPNENFLDFVVGHFDDDKIGYVQAVQGYYNQDSTVIARAAAEQTYLFYGPIMIGLNALGTVPAIGANCIFRRRALDSIGGHAPGLTEDMHTSMLLHAKGWKSVYIPSILNRGLVPWNFSGYCKQQLKWSRGTFDLMFNKLPPIFKNLTLTQKIYYLSCGFFYTYGFKVMMDIMLPILALVLVKVPLKVDIIDFYKHFLPFWLLGQFIRLYCQRWLMGDKERGLYLLGSILLKSSWWVALTGFIYTVVGKNVPYIPTPKHNKHETPWVILIPNLVVIAVSLGAIAYGLRADLNPYSIFMAFIALFNIITLGLGTLMAMQTWIAKIHAVSKRVISKQSWLRVQFYHLRMLIYRRAENGMAALFVITLLLFLMAQFYFPNFHDNLNAKKEKYFGDLNLTGGLPVGNPARGLQRFDISENTMRGAGLLDSLSVSVAEGRIPFLYIQHAEGILDSARIQKNFGPLIRYVRDRSPMICISLRRGNTSEVVYYENMLNLASSFASHGAGGVAWTWDLQPSQDSVYLNRSTSFVSWILNDSKNQNTTSAGMFSVPGQETKLPVVFFTNKMNQFAQAELATLGKDSTAANAVQKNSHVTPTPGQPDTVNRIQQKAATDLPLKQWDVVNRKLRIGSKEFFITGIAYNPGHDWQDDKFNIPLTRDKLREDFKAIKAMGANTIRRYSPGISDYNIFRAAAETDLNVLYGFWFDPQIDYATDVSAMEKYREEVLSKVQSYKSKPCIIGWSVGNETWGLLKHNYGEPYLTQVRKKYVQFIESLAHDIRAIDPARPVFTMAEHTPMLVTELNMYRLFAPSIDIYGINSYYEQNLVQLDSLMRNFFPQQYYIVSEFGPPGYWNDEYNHHDTRGKLIETSAYDKAHEYQSNWSRFVLGASDQNLGGVAFCWQDRFEGTTTWFGLTDIHGYKKPAYYALAEAWTGAKHQFSLPNISIVVSTDKSSDGSRLFYAMAPSGHRLTGPRFKWMVYDNKTFEKKFETSFSKENFIQLPPDLQHETNRLYLYMTDFSGSVVTASFNF
jgi:cellulose synthase (UDP-forming)